MQKKWCRYVTRRPWSYPRKLSLIICPLHPPEALCKMCAHTHTDAHLYNILQLEETRSSLSSNNMSGMSWNFSPVQSGKIRAKAWTNPDTLGKLRPQPHFPVGLGAHSMFHPPNGYPAGYPPSLVSTSRNGTWTRHVCQIHLQDQFALKFPSQRNPIPCFPTSSDSLQGGRPQLVSKPI